MLWQVRTLVFGLLLCAQPLLEVRADVSVDLPSAHDTQSPRAQSVLLDLNTASVRELRGLPGISRSNSFAIRNGRPYARTEDLLLRRVIARRFYERISPLITVVPLPQSALVNVNTASIRHLQDLSGMRKSRALAIVNARPYARTDDLVSRRVVSPREFERIKLLITVGPP